MGIEPDTYLSKGKVYEGDLTPTMYDPNLLPLQSSINEMSTFQPVDRSHIIKCDNGKYRKFMTEHFLTLEEWREKQLNKIL